MRLTIRLWLMFALSPVASPAQSQGLFKYLTDNVAIRKNFDGTKDEQNPAAFMYLRERTAVDPEVSTIDVAVKLLERELLPQSSLSWIVYPVVDYHRSSNTDGRVSKIGFTGKTEFRPFGMGPKPPGSRAIFLPIVPNFAVDAKIARDWEKDADETRVGAQAFLSSLRKGFPGAQWRTDSGVYRGRYYVYGGADRYRFLGGSQDTLLTAAYGRFWAEWLPFATDSATVLQFTTEITSRHRVSAAAGYPKQLSDFSVGVNFYPGRQEAFAVGVEYANGHDAAKRFRRREGVTLAVKLKL